MVIHNIIYNLLYIYYAGHVECLEAGIFRADIPCKFTLIPSALQQLIGMHIYINRVNSYKIHKYTQNKDRIHKHIHEYV